MGTRRQGVGVSDGLHLGPVRLLAPRSGDRRQASGDPATEEKDLRAALARAAAELEDLITRVDSEAAGMLAFQVAMLEDEALIEPALAAMAGGMAAEEAWRKAIDAQAGDYEASEDEYFRARASDLRDMCDRVLRRLAGGQALVPEPGAVLLGEDLAPSAFLEWDWSAGGAIALAQGSGTSHVAMLARARGIPMVVGLGELPAHAGRMIVDGGSGWVTVDLGPGDVSAFETARGEAEAVARRAAGFLLAPATRKGGERIDVLVNVAGLEDLDGLDPRSCDGIGLMRSEFLFRDGAPLPDEDTQYRTYRRFLEWAGPRPVTIRTLDIGGDKPVRGLTPEGESNPFLGLRGVRLTLAREEVFRTQLRALARAAAHGNLKVMLPMVTVPAEISRSAALLEACIAELQGAGIACGRPPLGIMIEVPAAAIMPELFHEAEFFSIGSNDLTQYVTASSRDDARVAALNDPSHPAVLRLIGHVTRWAEGAGLPVSLCGDMASEPRHLEALLAAGLTSLSVAPSRLARVKAAIAEL